MTNRSGSGMRRFLSSWLGRLFIAAVAIGALAFAVWLFFFVGNGRDTSRAGVSVIQARLIAPDKLRLNVNSCNKNAGVSDLVETDVDVQVKVVADYDPSPLFVQECDDAVEVQLAKPLGDRDVVDKHTGEVVRVQRNRAQKARDDVADLPDVAPPKIGDAPNDAELEDLQFIADQEGISLQTAIERYGWQDNFSLAVAQIQEAVSVAFVGAEIVDDSNAWIAFKGNAPQAALVIINEFRSSHRGVSVHIRTGKEGLTEEERSKVVTTVHHAVYRDPEVRDATTYFDRDTSQIRTTVVLDAAASDSAIERLKAFAETKLIEVTRADILNSISVVVVRSELDGLGCTEPGGR